MTQDTCEVFPSIFEKIYIVNLDSFEFFYLCDRPRDKTSVFNIIAVSVTHSVGFPTSCLAVCHYRRIVAIEKALD
jgi:hypothetical protein